MKKGLTAFLAAVLLLAALPVSSVAAETEATGTETADTSAALVQETRANASGTCGDSLTWTLDSAGTLTISGTGEMSDYTYMDTSPWYSDRDEIQSIVLEPGVTSIGACAFYNCSNVTGTVTIPDSVTEIGASAFMNCTKLTGVVIPEGVTRLENDAFMSCRGLTEIELPGSLTYIGGSAFYRCTGLTSITFCGDAPRFYPYSPDSTNGVFTGVTATAYYPAGNRTWTDANMLDYGGTITWQAGKPSEVDSGTCGDGLTWTLDSQGTLTISGEGAMADYSVSSGSPWYSHRKEIQTIVLEPGVTSIGAYAFQSCANVTGTVTIPDSVTKIGVSAFSGCTKLTGVEIPEGVTRLENNTFTLCESLTEIELPGSLTYLGCAFRNCSSLTSITFQGDAPSFYPYRPGDTVGVFTGVTATAYYPAGNRTWTDANMLDYGGTITWMPFGTPPEIASGTCGDGLTWTLDSQGTLTISGEGAMADYSVSSGSPWYSHRKEIQTIVLEPGVTSIGAYAFQSCANVTGTVTIPDSVTKIGASAFMNCTKLTGVVIPEGVTRLENNTFTLCESLTEIELPGSLTYLGCAFRNCSSLTSITFQGDAPSFYPYSPGDTVGVFTGVTATAYYPADNDTWTDSVRKDYGGTISWKPSHSGVTLSGTIGSWEMDAEAKYLLYDATLTDAEIREDLALDVPQRALASGTGGECVTGEDGSYTQSFALENVEAGSYQLAIYKNSKYVPQILEVTAGEEDVDLGQLSVQTYGDVNGDGQVTIIDAALTNACARGTSELEAYAYACADVSGEDGQVTIIDAARINAHARGVTSLWQ